MVVLVSTPLHRFRNVIWTLKTFHRYLQWHLLYREYKSHLKSAIKTKYIKISWHKHITILKHIIVKRYSIMFSSFDFINSLCCISQFSHFKQIKFLIINECVNYILIMDRILWLTFNLPSVKWCLTSIDDACVLMFENDWLGTKTVLGIIDFYTCSCMFIFQCHLKIAILISFVLVFHVDRFIFANFHALRGLQFTVTVATTLMLHNDKFVQVYTSEIDHWT